MQDCKDLDFKQKNRIIIPSCPKCGSGNITEITCSEFECDDCGYKWSR